jgi:hypothetical protein
MEDRLMEISQLEGMDEEILRKGAFGAFEAYTLGTHEFLVALFDTPEEAAAERDRLAAESSEDDDQPLHFAAWVHPDLAAKARRRFEEGEEILAIERYSHELVLTVE